MLPLGVAVVEHVAHDLVAGGGEAQGAGGGNAEMVHGLAAQELADRAAQDGEAVGAYGCTGVGPAPLSCKGVANPVGGDDLAEGDGPAVAELAGPVAELVAAVARRIGLHRVERGVAGEHPHELVGVDHVVAETEVGEHLW